MSVLLFDIARGAKTSITTNPYNDISVDDMDTKH